MPRETYISVDVETAGPVPARFALLSIGACLVEDPTVTFYMELQPDRTEFLPDALAISGLDLERQRQAGRPPRDAMVEFEQWVEQAVPHGNRAVFVALNAPFDWMFVQDYFHRYLGRSPFGHSALDIKAYYMGLTGVSWSETSWEHITARLERKMALAHNALRDAQDQAEIFRALLRRASVE